MFTLRVPLVLKKIVRCLIVLVFRFVLPHFSALTKRNGALEAFHKVYSTIESCLCSGQGIDIYIDNNPRLAHTLWG